MKNFINTHKEDLIATGKTVVKSMLVGAVLGVTAVVYLNANETGKLKNRVNKLENAKPYRFEETETPGVFDMVYMKPRPKE